MPGSGNDVPEKKDTKDQEQRWPSRIEELFRGHLSIEKIDVCLELGRGILHISRILPIEICEHTAYGGRRSTEERYEPYHQ